MQTMTGNQLRACLQTCVDQELNRIYMMVYSHQIQMIRMTVRDSCALPAARIPFLFFTQLGDNERRSGCQGQRLLLPQVHSFMYLKRIHMKSVQAIQPLQCSRVSCWLSGNKSMRIIMTREHEYSGAK
jgi:hypothetical protein